MFLIPYNKLSEIQKRIIQRISREQSNLFVEGPPGSGKTLISLHYVKGLSNDQVTKPLVLLYNKSLYGYLRKSFEELEISDNITLETKDKFFWDLANKYGIRPYGRDREYDDRYSELLSALIEINITENWTVAVVDEVQDLNKLEWTVLKKIAKKVISMGDFNQKVYDTDLTREDVVTIGFFEKLTEIFRFHTNIAKIAQSFSKNKEVLDQQVTRVEAEEVSIIETRNTKEEAQKVKEIVASLIRKDGRIGLICPGHDRMKEMHQDLEDLGVPHTHYGREKKFFMDHDFNDKKPLLITSASSKGLEFDHVIVYGFDGNDNSVHKYIENLKLQGIIYVSLTRANSGLYILRNPHTIPEIKKLKVESSQNIEKITMTDIFG